MSHDDEDEQIDQDSGNGRLSSPMRPAPSDDAADAEATTDESEEQQAFKSAGSSTLSENDDNMHDLSCPICFESSSVLLTGSCGHAACAACLEQLLMHKSNAMDRMRRQIEISYSPSAMEPIWVLPTLGNCPICRGKLHLYDLKRIDTDDNSDETTAFPYRHEYKDWRQTPLRNAVYVESLRVDQAAVGYGSLHFEDSPQEGPFYNIEQVVRLRRELGEEYDENNQAVEHPIHLPIQDITWHEPTRTLTASIQFVRGTDETCGNDPPMVMAGVGEPFSFRAWSIYVSLSADFTFCRMGLIHKIRRPVKSIPHAYPLDGTWQEIRGSHNNGDTAVSASTVVEVQGSTCWLGNGPNSVTSLHLLKVQRSRGEIQMISGRNAKVVYVAKWDWNEHPTGPPPKACLKWRLLDAQSDPKDDDEGIVLSWNRRTVSNVLPPDQVDYLGGSSGRMYRLLTTNVSRTAPTYHSNTLAGNTFCQGFKIGLASYHFVASDTDPNVVSSAYISYEHPATSQWPPLDNGMPVPSRMYFTNIDYSHSERTFRGTIAWLEELGTTWQRMAKWDYVMTFDSLYTCIVSGTVHSTYLGSNQGQRQEMSRYGETLVYVNAALFDAFSQERSQAATQVQNQLAAMDPSMQPLVEEASIPLDVSGAGVLESNNSSSTIGTAPTNARSPQQRVQAAAAAFQTAVQEALHGSHSAGGRLAAVSAANHFQRQSQSLRRRLQEEGASIRTQAIVHHLLTAAQEPDRDNPIDLNLQ